MFIPVEQVDFGRQVVTECELIDRNLEKSEDDLKTLLRELAASGVAAAVESAFFTKEELYPEDEEVIYKRNYAESLQLSRFYDERLKSLSLEQLIEHCKNINWRFSEEDCRLVETLTKDQAADVLWFKMRYGRITASCFAKAVKTRVEQPSVSLIKQICGQNKCQDLPSMLHGKINERNAIKAAIKLFEDEGHTNFRFERSGLVIRPEFPYFGGSPDQLFYCDCCKLVVVEAKCPFKCIKLSEEEGITSLLTRRTPYIVRMEDGSLVMNPKHEYYYQIQMQIFLCKASYGIFVIWAPKFCIRLKIEPNVSFWKVMSQKAGLFFENVIAPEICANFFTSHNSAVI